MAVAAVDYGPVATYWRTTTDSPARRKIIEDRTQARTTLQRSRYRVGRPQRWQGTMTFTLL